MFSHSESLKENFATLLTCCQQDPNLHLGGQGGHFVGAGNPASMWNFCNHNGDNSIIEHASKQSECDIDIDEAAHSFLHRNKKQSPVQVTPWILQTPPQVDLYCTFMQDAAAIQPQQ